MLADGYQINIDGASTPQAGRKGPAAAAIYVRHDEKFHYQESLFMNGTNNEAELYALYMAVKWASKNTQKDENIEILSDSLWVVHCFAKKAKLKYLAHWETTHYPDLFLGILKYWDEGRMSIHWIPREKNKNADRLAQSTKKRGY